MSGLLPLHLGPARAPCRGDGQGAGASVTPANPWTTRRTGKCALPACVVGGQGSAARLGHSPSVLSSRPVPLFPGGLSHEHQCRLPQSVDCPGAGGRVSLWPLLGHWEVWVADRPVSARIGRWSATGPWLEAAQLPVDQPLLAPRGAHHQHQHQSLAFPSRRPLRGGWRWGPELELHRASRQGRAHPFPFGLTPFPCCPVSFFFSQQTPIGT